MSDRTKVLIALGGNALQNKDSDGTAESQLAVVRQTAEYLAELTASNYEIAIVHGNGPQVGRILLSSEAAADVAPPMPLDVCGAMSQGYIGYQVQQALRHALNKRGIDVDVVSLTSQTIVDAGDPSFANPTKPIGPFYSEDEAHELERARGFVMREDVVRDGWRRVVASPKPVGIVEIDAIKRLWDTTIVICAGGGGVPVVQHEDGTMEGVAAVIDKDFAAELVAENVDADVLMILTEVDKVAINFGTSEERWLDHLSLEEAARYAAEGQFGAGSMLPKVQACMKFVRRYPGKKAIITSLNSAIDALEGRTGTVITYA